MEVNSNNNGNNYKIIDNEQKIIKINYNPSFYSLDIIYSGCYVFLDKAYFNFQGNPKENIEIIIELKDKEGNIDNFVKEFNNSLINYIEYKQNLDNNKELRQLILQRALITNDKELVEEFEEDLFSDDELLEDPQDIATPWEEKYSNNN